MTIFICGLPDSAVQILRRYLDVFCKDATIENLKPVAVKGKVKTKGARASVGLIILEASAWESCSKLARSIIELPKCHKYINNDGLEKFLISRLGELPNDTVVEEPVSDDIELGTSVDLDEDNWGLESISPQDDDIDVLESEPEVDLSQYILITKHEEMVNVLRMQINSLSKDLEAARDGVLAPQNDISEYISRINTLQDNLDKYSKKITDLESQNSVLSNRALRAESLVENMSGLRRDLTVLNDIVANLREKNEELDSENKSLLSEVQSLTEAVSKLKSIESKYEELCRTNSELSNDLDTVKGIKAGLEGKLETANNTVDALRKRLEQLSDSCSDKERLASELSILTPKLERAEARVRDLEISQTKLSEANITIVELRQELNNTQSQIDSYKATIASLGEDVEEKKLEAVLSQREEEVVSLTQKVKELEGTAKSLNEEISTLRSKLEGTSDTERKYRLEVEKTSKLEGDISALTEALQNKNSELEKVKANNALIQQSRESDTAGYKEEINNRIAEVKKVSQDLSNLKKEYENSTEELKKKESLNVDLANQVSILTESLSKNEKQLQDFQGRIVTLNKELEEKASEISRVSSLLNDSDNKMQSSTKELVALREQLDSISQELTDTKGTLKVTLAERDKYKGQINQNESTLSTNERSLMEAQSKLDNSLEQINVLNDRLSAKEHQILAKEDEIASLKEKEEALTAKIDTLEKEKADIQDQFSLRLSNKAQEISQLESQILELKSEYENKVRGIEDKQSEIGKEYELLSGELSKEKKLVQDKDVQITDLQEQLKKQKGLLVDSDKEKEALRVRLTNLSSEHKLVLSDKDKEITSLNDSLKEKSDECEDLQARITELESRYDSKVKEYSVTEQDKDSSITQLQDIIEKLREDKSSLTKKIRVRESKITQLETDIRSLRSDITSLNSQLERQRLSSDTELRSLKEGYTSEMESKDLEIVSLKSTIKKLQKKVDTEHEKYLYELREKDDKLVSLNTELTLSQSKVHALEKANQSLLNEGVSIEEVTSLKRHLRTTESALKQKEEAVIELEDVLSSYENNIFSGIANCALPKNLLDVELHFDMRRVNNVFILAGGSNASVDDVSSVIGKEVRLNKDLSYVVIDLSSESSLDYELGTSKVKNPIAWLQGSSDLDSCLSNSKYPNVRVLTLAMSFVNEAFLLTVDWDAILAELSDRVDTVIISVGNLGSIVRDVLFNSFLQVCDGYVISNSNPFSLRATVLHLRGIPRQDYMVVCTRFRTSSQQFYKKLSSSYKSMILDDKAAINFTRGE